MTSDEALLAGLKAGREDVYVAVLDLYQAPIYRFFVFAHGDPELAEDQVCETFAALVSASHRLKSEDFNLRAYLYGIARKVRASRSREPREIVLSGELLDSLLDHSDNPRDLVSRREEVAQAINTLMELKEPARQIILLRFVEEMPLADIAGAMDMPLNSVKSHVRRGLQKTRDLMIINDGTGLEPIHE